MNCVLLDVTHTKREQEKLRLTMERHQIIMDQTNDIIFEWDIHQNKILYSSNWAKKFGYQPIMEEIDRRIPQASHVFPEDMPNFLKLMKDVGPVLLTAKRNCASQMRTAVISGAASVRPHSSITTANR